jgi:plasmid stabilization system protein ParE
MKTAYHQLKRSRKNIKMGLTVFWTHFAQNKLDDIYKYYKEKAGVRVPKKLVNGLVNTSLELEKSPLLRQ